MKVALLSFAHIHAATYIQLLRDRCDIDLVVTDPDAEPGDPTRGKALADELGVSYRSGYEEVLSERPRAVIVTSENARHRGLVEQAAAAGAHVLCEKPLATTESDARAMIYACEQAGVSLMTAYPVRFHPAFAALRHTLADGTLGPLLSIHGVNNSRPPGLVRPWFADPVLAGGGAIMDHTLHIADLLGVLLQGEQPTHVHAAANTLLTPDRTGKPAVESAGLLTLAYPRGLVATIDCSWSHPASHPTWGGLRPSPASANALLPNSMPSPHSSAATTPAEPPPAGNPPPSTSTPPCSTVSSRPPAPANEPTPTATPGCAPCKSPWPPTNRCAPANPPPSHQPDQSLPPRSGAVHAVMPRG
ncbi:Gfo/Idh/MocA family oxidoreductase [Streptomyces sp. PmtA]|uniref:Gfo/Idh/MocA family protein n=1 Tax=Streptomyces sp. PmtA TaxID=3074275 RepID=UPI0030142595